MTDNARTKLVKQRNRKELALKMNTAVLGSMTNIRRNTIVLASALYEIEASEYWKELDYTCFEAYCASPEISLPMKTVKRYISLYVAFKDYPLEQFQDIAIAKLEVLKIAKDPSKYFDEAKTLALSDLRKEVLESETGVKADDKEIETYIRKTDATCQCPHWDPKSKVCVKD